MPFLENILNWFYGTPAFGSEAQARREMPICGVPDNLRMAAEPNRWGITHLKWFVESRPVGVGITDPTYSAEVAKAFGRWSAVCPLTFEQTSERGLAHVALRTGRGPEFGFSGRSGPAANAFTPANDHFVGQLFVTLNADKTWVIKQAGSGGIILLPVLVHEIGHILGLFHSLLDNQAMSKGAYFDAPQAEDIQLIQLLYGRPVVPTPPPEPPAENPFCRVTIGKKTYEATLQPIN